MLLLVSTKCPHILLRPYHGHLITLHFCAREPHILISHRYSFLEFSWLFLNASSSRWTLESFFKVSKKILLGFSLELHLIYRLIWGKELASSQFWVLCENETWFPNCSSLCLNVSLRGCITNRFHLFLVKFVSGYFTGFFYWFYDYGF